MKMMIVCRAGSIRIVSPTGLPGYYDNAHNKSPPSYDFHVTAKTALNVNSQSHNRFHLAAKQMHSLSGSSYQVIMRE